MAREIGPVLPFWGRIQKELEVGAKTPVQKERGDLRRNVKSSGAKLTKKWLKLLGRGESPGKQH